MTVPLEISAEELKQKFTAGEKVYLLDVRAEWEHALAKIKEGALVPLQEIQQRLAEVKPGEGEQLVAYCHHGMRSGQAASFLRQVGFPEARSLAGGIDRWSMAIDPSVPRY
jgi:rhodanese-related sulfurtransferase